MLLETDQDRARFSQLYETYYTKLYRIARHVLASEALAMESVQNSFFKIALHFEKINALTCREMEAYIVTIVEHDALDVLQKEQRASALPEDWDVQDPNACPEGETAFRHLVAIVNSMPETYREVLLYKLVLEWPDEEIARELRIKLGTVTSRISRGRALLIERLEQEGYTRDGR